MVTRHHRSTACRLVLGTGDWGLATGDPLDILDSPSGFLVHCTGKLNVRPRLSAGRAGIVVRYPGFVLFSVVPSPAHSSR